MPKKAEELSPLAVSRITTPGLHFVGGVAGLALQVLKSGGRTWVLRARISGEVRDMGLGGFPDVTLAGAREAARAARARISAGVDPIAERRAAVAMLSQSKANALSFETASLKYLEAHEPGWKNAKHAQQWRNSLTNHAFPVLGKLLVRDIGLPQVLEVLEPLWRTKTETATRVRGRVEKILDWSTTKGYREGLNPARWKGHLDNLLPAANKIAKERHFPALPVGDIGAFMQALRTQAGTGARALEFGILTAARSEEIRGATWAEVNLDMGEWVIPAARMKMAKEHIVPLSPPALALLKSLPRIAGTDLVFVAPRGGQFSDGTLNAVIKRMNEVDMDRWIDPVSGRTVVQHGFRSTFRDWASEISNHPGDVAEMALAHAIRDKTEAAYRRGALFVKRQVMMNEWADFVATPLTEANVLQLRRKRA